MNAARVRNLLWLFLIDLGYRVWPAYFWIFWVFLSLTVRPSRFSPPARWGSLEFIRVASASSFSSSSLGLSPELRVGTAGLQPRAPGTAGLQPQVPDLRLPDPNRECERSDRMPQRIPKRMWEYTSDNMRDRMPEYVSDKISVDGDHSKKVILLLCDFFVSVDSY